MSLSKDFLSKSFSLIHKLELICKMRLQAMKWSRCFSVEKREGWSGAETLGMKLDYLDVFDLDHLVCRISRSLALNNDIYASTASKNQKLTRTSSLNLSVYRWKNWGPAEGRGLLKDQKSDLINWGQNGDFNPDTLTYSCRFYSLCHCISHFYDPDSD